MLLISRLAHFRIVNQYNNVNRRNRGLRWGILGSVLGLKLIQFIRKHNAFLQYFPIYPIHWNSCKRKRWEVLRLKANIPFVNLIFHSNDIVFDPCNSSVLDERKKDERGRGEWCRLLSEVFQKQDSMLIIDFEWMAGRFKRTMWRHEIDSKYFMK